MVGWCGLRVLMQSCLVARDEAVWRPARGWVRFLGVLKIRHASTTSWLDSINFFSNKAKKTIASSHRQATSRPSHNESTEPANYLLKRSHHEDPNCLLVIIILGHSSRSRSWAQSQGPPWKWKRIIYLSQGKLLDVWLYSGNQVLCDR